VWQPNPEKQRRRHRDRYVGLRRKLCRASGLHPIIDKAIIDQLMPTLLWEARRLKANHPHIKYRNMKITRLEPIAKNEHGVAYNYTLSGEWTTAGPSM
jgi:hypothetical protein